MNNFKLATIALITSTALSFVSTESIAHTKHHQVESSQLSSILAKQPDEIKERYQYRNPKETIEYLGIKPGMKVAEVMPGGGWYSKILLPYLGKKGQLVGVDFAYDMWQVWIGSRENSEEFLTNRKSWANSWSERANKDWVSDGSAKADAFAFGAVPKKMHGTVDAFLWIRAIHHLGRFEDKGTFRMDALKEMYKTLKPGGIVGIVQHRAPEENNDEWAVGDNGYVKQSAVIAYMKKAGFELVGTSEINANAKDKPTDKDNVWRLAPSYDGADTDEKKAAIAKIGESDRMTLKFRKPV